MNLSQSQPIMEKLMLQEFESGRNADLEVHANGQVFKVMKNMLSMQSSVFQEMFGGDIVKELTRPVKINGYDTELIKKFLLYFYIGKIDGLETDVMQFFKLADYYGVKSLKDSCFEIMFSKMSVENVYEHFEMASKIDSIDLEQRCVEFMSSNITMDTYFMHYNFAKEHELFGLMNDVVDFIKKNVNVVAKTKEWNLFDKDFRLNIFQSTFDSIGNVEETKTNEPPLICTPLSGFLNVKTDFQGTTLDCRRKAFCLKNTGTSRLAFKCHADFYFQRETHYFHSYPTTGFIKPNTQIEIGIVFQEMRNFIILYENSEKERFHECFESGSSVKLLKIDL